MIRALRKEEVAALIPGAKTFVGQVNPNYTMDESGFLKTWETLLEHDLGTIYVVEHGSDFSAAMGFGIHYDFIVSAVIAQEAFWFTLPEYLGEINNVRLFFHAEEQLGKRGVKHIRMFSIDHLDMHRYVERFYLRQGYSVLEHVYTKEL